MAIVGLTGNLASGKSSVTKLLKSKGAVIFDSDKMVHSYYKYKKGEVFKKIARSFPQCQESGRILRNKLRREVFSDPKKLKRLENIIHPRVIKDLLIWIKKSKNKNKIYVAEVPLLFEKGLTKHFEKIILVEAKKDILIKRISEKYDLSKIQARHRLSLYIPLKEKRRKSNFIVKNNFDFKALQKEVDLLWKKLSLN